MTHVTVAGVVGTWWFAPEEASSVCSKAVCDSFARASFSSFGSICFGSLLAGLAQALHQIVKGLRRERDQDSLLLCLLECLLGIIESLVRYFNKWAYVYVGLYGYSYLESGEKVMTLFDQRGWTAIVNDQLVARVLAWMALLIGGLNGLGGWLLIQAYPSMLGLASPNASSWVAFITGFLIGAGVSNILVSKTHERMAGRLFCLLTLCLVFGVDDSDFECCRHGRRLFCGSTGRIFGELPRTQ